jgi:hypothetical protein
MSYNKHFDCLRNKLPDNWTNNNSTAYYNRAFWKRCKCEYGTINQGKAHADKWFPTETEPSRWTEGCSPCSPYYNKPHNFYYSYNPDDCGNCGNCGNCNNRCDCGSCNDCKRRLNPCGGECKCKEGCRCERCKYVKEDCHKDNDCDDKHKKYFHTFVQKGCRGCGNNSCNGCNDGCNGCLDVAIVYRMPFPEQDCDNIVELKIPIGGSKEKYLAEHFSPEFVYANRFQCATVPAFCTGSNNVIDNRKQFEFTYSDEASLTRRGINNSLFAQELVDEGKIIHNSYAFQIPMNKTGGNYSYLATQYNDGGTTTGIVQQDITKGYFR